MALLHFSNTKEAVEAKEKLNGERVEGRILSIKYSSQKLPSKKLIGMFTDEW